MHLQVEGNTISTIGPGLLCLVGVGRDDSAEDAEYMCACCQYSYSLGLVNLYCSRTVRARTLLPHLRVRVADLQLQEDKQHEALAKFEEPRSCL